MSEAVAPHESHLILAVAATPAGARFNPVAAFEGLTAEQIGRCFGIAVRGGADSARRFRDNIEATEPGAGAAFEAGYAAACGAAVGSEASRIWWVEPSKIA